jgi:hypothetical protein
MILIGAPVHERAWILKDWFEHLAAQEEFPPDSLEILFNYGPSSDSTLEAIQEEAQRGRFASVQWLTDVHGGHVGPRMWNLDRYAVMVRLRNTLLGEVRHRAPDFYLSCDTDMLLPPHTLRTLLQHMDGFNGIAPVAFMTDHGEGFPNCMDLHQLRDLPLTTSQEYAVFGVVLMDHSLYTNVDYEVHGLGEDLGWAKNAWEKKMRLALCPNVRVKHVMYPAMLETFDIRVGF